MCVTELVALYYCCTGYCFRFILRLEGLSKASAIAPSDKKTARDGASASISVTEDISVTVETEEDDEAKKIKVQITEELR